MKEQIVVCWSGGKDSCLALHELKKEGRYGVASLLTTVTEGYDRISMHGVRRTLLERQAESLGLPLQVITISPGCVNQEYESKMEQALRAHQQNGVQQVAFGDIFLEDLRQYRESNLAKIGMAGVFPIWKRDTRELVRTFLALGFRAIVVSVDPKALPAKFAGRMIDDNFLAQLPESVDPCGENGEFHTFVFEGPIFKQTVGFSIGETVQRDSFTFCDLMPAFERRTA